MEKNKIYIIIIGLMAVALLFINGFYLNKVNSLEKIIANLNKAPQNPQQFPQDAYEKVLGENQKTHFLKLLSPVGGENLCLGDDFNIQWEGSPDITDFNIVIRNNNTSYPLGSYPISYNEEGKNNGKGLVPWKVGDTKGGVLLREREGYQIIINGTYPITPDNKKYNTLITDFNITPFSIINCQG